MSAATDYPERLNLAEQVARIERMNAETAKLRIDVDPAEQVARLERMNVESGKFLAEQRKLLAEQQKLSAEAAKLERDRGLAPWLAAAAVGGAASAVVALTLRGLGVVG